MHFALVPVLSSQIDFMYLEDMMETKVSPLHTFVVLLENDK